MTAHDEGSRAVPKLAVPRAIRRGAVLLLCLALAAALAVPQWSQLGTTGTSSWKPPPAPLHSIGGEGGRVVIARDEPPGIFAAWNSSASDAAGDPAQALGLTTTPDVARAASTHVAEGCTAVRAVLGLCSPTASLESRP